MDIADNIPEAGRIRDGQRRGGGKGHLEILNHSVNVWKVEKTQVRLPPLISVPCSRPLVLGVFFYSLHLGNVYPIGAYEQFHIIVDFDSFPFIDILS